MKTIFCFSKILFVYILISICLSTISSYAQESSDNIISIDSTLVSVPVIVSDRQGRYVSGLKEQDFTIYDNQVKQSIAFFDVAEEPLNIALLLDTSKSTSEILEDIKVAAFTFLSELRPKDKIMIVSFDNEVNFLTALTNDRRKLEKAIYQAQIGYKVGTKLNDAVAQAILQLKPATGRKAIVLLTDGKDHGSYLEADELMDKVIESNTLIYTIFYATQFPRVFDQSGRSRNIPKDNPRGEKSPFPPFIRRGQIDFPRFPKTGKGERRQERRQERVKEKNEQAMDFLNELAEVTAGRMYESEVTDLRKTFSLIADELRHQYILGFYPDNSDFTDTPHTIKVLVAHKELVIRTRRNYRRLQTTSTK